MSPTFKPITSREINAEIKYTITRNSQERTTNRKNEQKCELSGGAAGISGLQAFAVASQFQPCEFPVVPIVFLILCIH